MWEDSVYSLYNMKMQRASISLIRNLGRYCQKVVLLLRCDFSIADSVLFDWGWEKREKGSWSVCVCVCFSFFFKSWNSFPQGGLALAHIELLGTATSAWPVVRGWPAVLGPCQPLCQGLFLWNSLSAQSPRPTLWGPDLPYSLLFVVSSPLFHFCPDLGVPVLHRDVWNGRFKQRVFCFRLKQAQGARQRQRWEWAPLSADWGLAVCGLPTTSTTFSWEGGQGLRPRVGNPQWEALPEHHRKCFFSLTPVPFLSSVKAQSHPPSWPSTLHSHAKCPARRLLAPAPLPQHPRPGSPSPWRAASPPSLRPPALPPASTPGPPSTLLHAAT